jgi:hypothetical protein
MIVDEQLVTGWFKMEIDCNKWCAAAIGNRPFSSTVITACQVNIPGYLRSLFI